MFTLQVRILALFLRSSSLHYFFILFYIFLTFSLTCLHVCYYFTILFNGMSQPLAEIFFCYEFTHVINCFRYLLLCPRWGFFKQFIGNKTMSMHDVNYFHQTTKCVAVVFCNWFLHSWWQEKFSTSSNDKIPYRRCLWSPSCHCCRFYFGQISYFNSIK